MSPDALTFVLGAMASEQRAQGAKRTKAAHHNARFGERMPYAESASESPQHYSYETGGVHFIMLGSYIDLDPRMRRRLRVSPQHALQRRR